MNTDPNDAPLPDDEPSSEELAAAGTIRPMDELPSPWTITGAPGMIAEPTLQSISPADQKIVLERAGSANPEAVNKALTAFLKERQREFRIRCGAGEGATATEREALEQMNGLRLLSQEVDRLEAELAEVSEHQTQYDDAGKPYAVPVYTHQGTSRTAKQYRLNEIKYEMALIAGPQGEAALARAARADALKARELKAQIHENREGKRRGEAMLAEERINARAETYAKHRRNNV